MSSFRQKREKIGKKRFSFYQEILCLNLQWKNFYSFHTIEGMVGHRFGEFSFTRKRRPSRKNIGPKEKGVKIKYKHIQHLKEVQKSLTYRSEISHE